MDKLAKKELNASDLHLWELLELHFSQSPQQRGGGNMAASHTSTNGKNHGNYGLLKSISAGLVLSNFPINAHLIMSNHAFQVGHQV